MSEAKSTEQGRLDVVVDFAQRSSTLQRSSSLGTRRRGTKKMTARQLSGVVTLGRRLEADAGGACTSTPAEMPALNGLFARLKLGFKRLMGGHKTFAHGVYPIEHKELPAGKPIRRLPFADELIIPLRQHRGAPSVPT
ncbi:MAG: hypothetical protein N2690_12855, partial [Rhodocyclaceae bacterium]|nr:hypothetical protein [Rhodocyclaceae bacterium]